MIVLINIAVTAALIATVMGSVTDNAESYEVESALELLPMQIATAWREDHGSGFGRINYTQGNNLPNHQPKIHSGNDKPSSRLWSRSKTSNLWTSSKSRTTNSIEGVDGQTNTLSAESRLQRQFPIYLVSVLSESPVGQVGKRQRRSKREYKPKWGKGKKTG